MRIVVAPDKFKGCATAAEVAQAIAAGLRAGRPELEVVEVPVADGGDGTVAAAVGAGFSLVQVLATGPTGAPVQATFALRGSTAVIELAEVAGLRQLPGGQLAPLTASTYGLGQVIAAALDADVRTIVLGIGGSASTDGGAGMLQALGALLTDRQGHPLGPGGAALSELARIDLAGLDRRLADVRFLVASDVDNPLLGRSGAAAVFSPQKGATPPQTASLERALARWAELTASATKLDLAAAPGAGAAGGAGFAALAYLGAELLPGIELVLELIGFDAALTGAGLVITGEGRLDAQSLSGKAPVGVARAAARHGIPVAAVAGQVLLTDAELAAAGFTAAFSLVEIEPDPAVSIARAASLLELIGRQIAASGLVAA